MKHIAVLYSEHSGKIYDALPSNVNRSSIVHSLIRALCVPGVKYIAPEPLEEKQMDLYHSEEYLEVLKRSKCTIKVKRKLMCSFEY
jgi:acetoin utilization deacetylase AcuC-like enzyme